MEYRFADRINNLKPSAIREILKNTDPNVIPLAAGNPAVESFPIAKVYQAHIPTFPSGHWLFGFASKKYHPLRDLDEARWNRRKLPCWYYTTTLHKGAFYIPAYVEELLKHVEAAD